MKEIVAYKMEEISAAYRMNEILVAYKVEETAAYIMKEILVAYRVKEMADIFIHSLCATPMSIREHIFHFCGPWYFQSLHLLFFPVSLGQFIKIFFSHLLFFFL